MIKISNYVHIFKFKLQTLKKFSVQELMVIGDFMPTIGKYNAFLAKFDTQTRT